MCIISFNILNTLLSIIWVIKHVPPLYLFVFFIWGNWLQKGEVACSRSISWSVVKLRVKYWPFDFIISTVNHSHHFERYWLILILTENLWNWFYFITTSQAKKLAQRGSGTFQVYSQTQSEKVKVKSLSCVRLCNPINCSLPGFSVHGILQARILEWVAIYFSRGSSWPKNRTQVSCIAGRCSTLWASREAPQTQSRLLWF